MELVRTSIKVLEYPAPPFGLGEKSADISD